MPPVGEKILRDFVTRTCTHAQRRKRKAEKEYFVFSYYTSIISWEDNKRNPPTHSKRSYPF